MWSASPELGRCRYHYNTGCTDDAWVYGRLRSSTRMRMLQDTNATICKNTGNANVTIWMEGRHSLWRKPDDSEKALSAADSTPTCLPPISCPSGQDTQRAG